MEKILRKIRGQGMTEYIVLVAVVVGIIVLVIKTEFAGKLSQGLTNIGTQVDTATKP